jgi:hypothetical protein
MPLTDFIDRHIGETAYLFGKGKSLVGYDFKQAGKLRCAINDVIQYVPDCTYGFANDGVQNWKDVYKKGQTLFQPKRCLGEYDSTQPGAVNCDVVTYDDTRNDLRLSLSKQEIAELPTIRRGTLGSALQILYVMGIRSVYMVGFDGGTYHAEGFEWRTRLRADHGKDYDAIRSAAIDAAFIMGIALKFHNHDHTMEANGKEYVRFTSNAMALGRPYAQGEVASFAPHVVRELIVADAAERYTPPTREESPQPERAVAPMPEREVAIMPQAKKRGRKPKQ